MQGSQQQSQFMAGSIAPLAAGGRIDDPPPGLRTTGSAVGRSRTEVRMDRAIAFPSTKHPAGCWRESRSGNTVLPLHVYVRIKRRPTIKT
jgi:hypothetical protein